LVKTIVAPLIVVQRKGEKKKKKKKRKKKEEEERKECTMQYAFSFSRNHSLETRN
jgi:inner membrane protein involved in colicin E2 resistance